MRACRAVLCSIAHLPICCLPVRCVARSQDLMVNALYGKHSDRARMEEKFAELQVGRLLLLCLGACLLLLPRCSRCARCVLTH
jgi:hypothetical protein